MVSETLYVNERLAELYRIASSSSQAAAQDQELKAIEAQLHAAKADCENVLRALSTKLERGEL